MRLQTKQGVRGFRTLVQKIRNYFKDYYISHWDWKEGAKKTLNPFPAIYETIRDIWWSGYYISKDIGVVNNQMQHTKHITLWDKIRLTYKSVIYPVLFNFSWRYDSGLGRYGWTRFRWSTLTYQRDHSEWFGGNSHTWKDKKFLFSKNWKDYDHQYEIGDNLGCWEQKVSEAQFYTHLDRKGFNV